MSLKVKSGAHSQHALAIHLIGDRVKFHVTEIAKRGFAPKFAASVSGSKELND